MHDLETNDTVNDTTTPSTTVTATTAETPPPGGTARRLLSRLLPFVSLGTATASAVWMERDATRASIVGVAALVGWAIVVVAAGVVRRVDDRDRFGAASKRHRLARFFALLVSQTVLQQALAFPLPFFVRATMSASGRPAPAHLPFLIAYAVALVVVAWDPAWAAAVRRPAFVMTLQAFAAFAALVVALPMLGVAIATSATIAGVVVAVAVVAGAALAGAVTRTHRRGARALLLFVVAVVVAVVAIVGARFVPPAPLSLGSATFATDVVDREPVGAGSTFSSPAVLWCHSAIRAPLGLRDRLVHVWRRDGREVARVPLDVAGGARAGGYRTWSRVREPGPGAWECRVETPLGQVVGVTSARVVPGRAPLPETTR